MIGLTTREMNTSGNARISTALSGIENAMFLGTISPKTTCKKVTNASATANDASVTPRSDRPVSPNGISSRWWIDGSATFRITSEQTVMPSWQVASMSVACSIAQSAVVAARLPDSAFGSICERRAEMTENSAPTKKAFSASSTTNQISPLQYSAIERFLLDLVDEPVVRRLEGWVGADI